MQEDLDEVSWDEDEAAARTCTGKSAWGPTAHCLAQPRYLVEGVAACGWHVGWLIRETFEAAGGELDTLVVEWLMQWDDVVSATTGPRDGATSD